MTVFPVYIFTSFLIINYPGVQGNTYRVKIGTDQQVNVVDERFLSFTVDPKYLFSSSGKYHSQECACMASSLAPGYLRIAGPSTSHMTFHNTTITFTDLNSIVKNDSDEETSGSEEKSRLKVKRRVDSTEVIEELKVSNSQWKKFTSWANSTGFDLVFALNNDQKMKSGLWDPNTAIDMLTVAEKVDIGDVYWQLGYECHNQSIEEYLNDLETLRVIIETFEPGQTHHWKVVGGDVTNCFEQDSKSDFKDYVTLSDDMLDAVMLEGNSSAQQLERMSDSDRLKLLRRLSKSSTPLWLTESPHYAESSNSHSTELNRAADWITSLGFSARNGFSVHFRELVEKELYEPTLSFYMALLFKNLVGERVLDVEMEASEAVLFAHCTSLRHKPVPGAVTLYGVNMDDEPARFSVKLSRREEGGDVMQFILGHDKNSNIMVNNRLMYFDSDMRPVVKRLRPYKTLLINLPARSIGFWVLANTNIDACHYTQEDEFVEAETIEGDTNVEDNKPESKEINSIENTTEASVESNKTNDDAESNKTNEDASIAEDNESEDYQDSIESKISNFNNNVDNVHKLLKTKGKINKRKLLNRSKRSIADLYSKKGIKREDFNEENNKRKPKRWFQWIKNIFSWGSNNDDVKYSKENRVKKHMRSIRHNVNKKLSKLNREKLPEKHPDVAVDLRDNLNRIKRNAMNEKHIFKRKDIEDNTSNENDILDDKEQMKMLKILHKLHKELKHLPSEEDAEYLDDESKDAEELFVKAKLSDDSTTLNFNEKSRKNMLKSTVGNVLGVLKDLNKNLKNFWSAFNLLE